MKWSNGLWSEFIWSDIAAPDGSVWGGSDWGDDYWGNASTPASSTAPSLALGDSYGLGSSAATLEGQDRRALGSDIVFDNDYHIDGDGDYETISGIPALRQAIYHRLKTRPGEFRIRPDYGVGVELYIKKVASSSNISALKSKIESELSKEPRIESVDEILVSQSQGLLQIQVTIAAKGRKLTFRPYNFTETGV